LSRLHCQGLPIRQHRADKTPSPEVEDETRYHDLGDHLSKTNETEFRNDHWRKTDGRIALGPLRTIE